MMMRPRHYSTLNRTIARSITYSLRQYDRKNQYKSNKNTYTNNNAIYNNNNTNGTTSDFDIFSFMIIFGGLVLFIMFMVALGS